MWDNWVIDVTHWSDDMPPCFIPIEDDGTIVTGMNIIQDTCPGKLVGVVHLGGQDAVEAWIRRHPDWHEQYVKEHP